MKLLGLTARSTFFGWKKCQGIALPKGTLERISHIFGIYTALQILFADERTARTPDCGGQMRRCRSAAARPSSVCFPVADLFVARQFLDAQRGGWA